jgi:hypothetical protein
MAICGLRPQVPLTEVTMPMIDIYAAAGEQIAQLPGGA